ncbi:MAG: GNAT family N-acetyltransferase [Lachnospiraceae bacterium]|nr:GNAT family N-acetyltransferase [Lachnospiraceae bacterium]
MDITTKLYNDNGIRIEAEGVGACSLGLCEDYARLLSVYIDEEKRNAGLGAALLDKTERKVYDYGKREIWCNFTSDNTVFEKLLVSSGYDITEVESIVSASAKDVLESEVVKKTLDMHFSDTEWNSFEELLFFQREELAELFEVFKINIKEKDLDRFDPRLSGVVYNKEYSPKSMILCTTCEDEVVVELLFGVSKRKPQFMLSALIGFGKALLAKGGADEFSRISMICINESVKPLLKKLINDECEIYENIIVKSAKKVIGEGSNEIMSSEYSINEKDENWMNELRDFPYQKNVNWKHQWMTDRPD